MEIAVQDYLGLLHHEGPGGLEEGIQGGMVGADEQKPPIEADQVFLVLGLGLDRVGQLTQGGEVLEEPRPGPLALSPGRLAGGLAEDQAELLVACPVDEGIELFDGAR